MLSSAGRLLSLAVLALMIGLALPDALAAQAVEPTAAAATAQAGEGSAVGRYALALAVVVVASVASTAIAGAVVRNMQRVAPPDDEERR